MGMRASKGEGTDLGGGRWQEKRRRVQKIINSHPIFKQLTSGARESEGAAKKKDRFERTEGGMKLVSAATGNPRKASNRGNGLSKKNPFAQMKW